MAAAKFYVVWVGHKPGVYRSWAECQAQTNGYPQAKFKSYESESEARQALRGILAKVLSELQSKVPIDTMNITPTSAPIGICFTTSTLGPSSRSTFMP